jgi:hypothetical protein
MMQLHFYFVSCSELTRMELTELGTAAYSLAAIYGKDVDDAKICLEVEGFKHQAQSLMPEVT